MTMTSPTKTILQNDLYAEYIIFSEGYQYSIPSLASTAVQAYYNINNTPTVADLLTLRSALEAAKSTAINDVDAIQELVFINALQDIVGREIANLKIGNPTDDLILADMNYPTDDLGVTYPSLLADLKTALADSSNTDTVPDLAAAIFFTVNALNPALTLVQLTADIQATVDSGVLLDVLVNNLLGSLNSINTAAASTIAQAFYGTNIFSAEEANLYHDIQNKELLDNANLIKLNLAMACSDANTNITQFAQAIYDSVLVVAGTRYASVNELKRDVEAGAAALTNGLVELKSNILDKLNAISPLATTDELLAEAVFATGCLIPSDPHDLSKDLPDANHLKGLQNIHDALMAATYNFDGDATALGTAILNAVTSAGGGNSLTLAEIVNDINASGDVNTVALGIYNALTALNGDTLTSDALAGAIFSNSLIISGHKKNLVDDLTAEQVDRNYSNMINNLKIAILNAGDANALKTAIYTNVGGSLVDINALGADVVQSITNLGLNPLKTNLIAALNNAELSADGVRSAIYSATTLISADPYNAATDIAAAETALDYKAMIISLLGICAQTMGAHPTITTPTQFATALVNVPQLFGPITATASAAEIAQDITDDIATGIWPDLPTLASAINDNLNLAYANYEFNAGAIEAAVFNPINPTDPTRAYNDALTTANLKSLDDIRSNLLNPCPKVASVDPLLAQCAQNILTAVANSNSFTAELSVDDLAFDLEATLAALTVPENWLDTALQYLMSQTTANLNALPSNALTDTDIVNAMYNTNNGIIDSNPYRMGIDLVASENYLGILAIRDSLINYLNSQATTNNDIGTYTFAQGILASLDFQSLDVNCALSADDLTATISYAMSQNNNFDSGLYNVAAALKDQLAGATSLAELQVDFFTTTPESTDTDNQDDDSQFLTCLNAINTASNMYPTIISNITTNLQNLSVGYTSQDVANAIVAAIILPGDPALSAALLKDNLDATNGNLSDIVAAIITQLGGLGATPMADDILGILFSANGASGILAASPTDPEAMLSDVDSSAGLTDNYPEVINQIVTNLSNPGSPVSYTNWKNFVSSSIYSGLNKIADGANGSVLSPMLTQNHLANDIDATCVNSVSCVQTLTGNLINALSGLAGAYISAAGISGALFNALTLHVATTQADAYNVDLVAAAAAHSSLTSIKANFQTAGTYANIGEFVTALLANIVSDTGITTLLTNGQLTGDVTATLNDNNALTLQNLANAVFASVYAAANSPTAMANAMFGDNIQAVYNSDQLYTDVVNYYNSRITSFYQQIADDFIDSFAIGNSANYATQIAFANLLVSTLGFTNPDWNNQRVLSDVQASNPVLATLALNIRSSMTEGALGSYTPENIANNMYSLLLALSDVDKVALNSDINADILAYGGANGLAQKVIDALNALPNGYTETQVATAIIENITPTAFNSSPYLSVSDMVTDILYTEGYSAIALTDLVENLKANLALVAANALATATDLNGAIYVNSNGIVPSNDDQVNFELDIYNAINLYNNFAVIKTALLGIATTDAAATAASVLSILQLATNEVVEADLASSLSNSVVTTYSDLMTAILGNLASTNVASINTAAKLLASAFYSPNAIIPQSEGQLSLDLTNADEIDNAVTITGAIGGGMCKDGATHIAYSCSKSQGVVTVGDVIAQNNCTISGTVMAKEACNDWALRGIDHYISFNGLTCSDYLNPQEAAMQCMSAMDYVAI